MKREIKRENGHISYHLWKHEMKFQDRLFNYMGHIICIVVDITHINTHIGPCYRVNCILAFPSKMIHFISFWDQEADLRICMVPYWFIIDQRCIIHNFIDNFNYIAADLRICVVPYKQRKVAFFRCSQLGHF